MRVISGNGYEFGKFQLDVDERVLLGGGATLEVTPKAFEILLLLIRNGGRTVTKEEIFQNVWPDSFVEETNLSHHIFRLRKILNETEQDKFIETVPRRGYRFVADVRPVVARTDSGASSEVSPTSYRGSVGKRLPFLTAAVAIVVVIGVAFLVYRSGILAKDTQSQAVETPDRERQSISRITTGGKYVAATISPDGKFVAYAQNYTSGEGNLYIRQLETNTERRLLEPADRNFGSISFSPDGTFIYYIAYEPVEPEGSLYRIPVIGGQAVQVLSGVKFMFSLSADGRQAAFYRFDEKKQRRIVIATLDGTGTEKTVLTLPNSGISSVPAFSPDGRFLSFSSAELDKDFTEPQFAISLVDVSTGEVRRLSDEKWSEIGKAVWLPDGKGLLFPGNRPRTGVQIYRMAYPSGEVQQITDELNYYGNYGMGVTRDGSAIVADFWETQAQLWSIDEDGSTKRAEQLTNGISDGANGLTALSDGRIIYSTRSGEDRDLWVLRDTDGMREGKPLTADTASETAVCAPGDGRYVVFASDRAGSSHLFKTNLDGTEVQQITSGNGSEGSPECARDGSYILYNSGGAIWKISPDGGEPMRLTDFECIIPSLSPDEKHFACIQPTAINTKNATLAIVPIEGGAPSKSFEIIPFAFYYRPVRWTPDGRGLVFKKTDKQIGNLWRQELNGGQPRQISDFKSDVIFNHAYSGDGKRLLVSRGKVAYNTVLIRNFD